MKASHSDISRTVSLSCFFQSPPPSTKKVAPFCKRLRFYGAAPFWWNMAPVLLAFVIGSWWSSQLMKYNVLWIIWAKRFACGKFIGMYAHCVSSDQDDNLIAGWLVASQVNTCKLRSCGLCYNRKDVGAEASNFFLLFSSIKTVCAEMPFQVKECEVAQPSVFYLHFHVILLT